MDHACADSGKDHVHWLCSLFVDVVAIGELLADRFGLVFAHELLKVKVDNYAGASQAEIFEHLFFVFFGAFDWVSVGVSVEASDVLELSFGFGPLFLFLLLPNLNFFLFPLL